MITIVTKDYCPYCKGAIQILDSLGVEYKNIDVANDEKFYLEVKSISGSHTVPQIFVGDIHGKFLGGYTELAALNNSGELEKLLK